MHFIIRITNLVKYMIIPAAFLQIERRTTRTARPPNTPTMIATDLPT